MKTEMHTHSQGASVCADVTDKQFIDQMLNSDVQAFVLVNHINSAFRTYPGQTYKEKIDYYLSRFDDLKALANSVGIKVFLGAEIVALTDDGQHQEFILLGFDRKFLYEHELVNKYDQQGLFELATKNGLFMYQTHPFRVGEKLGNPKFMHGAEAFNGHYHHDNNNEKTLEFCEKHSLIKLVGNDYHHYNQPLVGYANLPDYIENERQLARYLLNNQPQIYFDQEKCLFERQKYIEEKRSAK